MRHRCLGHITVIFASDLPDGIDGMTDGHRVWIRTQLSPEKRRSVLAHELVHIERGINIRASQVHAEEALVEAEASRRCIPLSRLAASLAKHGMSCGAVAHELFVDVQALETRLKTLNRFERCALRALIARFKKSHHSEGAKMKRILLAATAAFALAACTAPIPAPTESAPHPDSSTVIVPHRHAEDAKDGEPVYAKPAEDAYVVRCLSGTPGPALWSDGSRYAAAECGAPQPTTRGLLTCPPDGEQASNTNENVNSGDECRH